MPCPLATSRPVTTVSTACTALRIVQGSAAVSALLVVVPVLCRPDGDQRGLLVRVERVPEVPVLQLHRRNMRSYLALAGQCFGTGDRPSPEDATQVF